MKAKELQIAIFWLLISTLVFLLDGRSVFAPLRSATGSVTIPVKAGLAGVREQILSPWEQIFLAREKGEQIAQMQDKLFLLSAQIARLQSVEEENERLRKLLGSPLSASWKFAPAQVVTQQENELILVSDYQPTPGTAVIIPSARQAALLVGVVDSVQGREIRAKLPSHQSFRIPVYVRNPSGDRTASGIVSADSGKVILSQVVSGESLETGFMVLTKNSSLPPDLLLGEVEQVLPHGGQTFKRARIKVAYEPVPEIVFFVTEF